MQAAPRVEVLFDGDSVRPFLAGMIGVGRIVQYQKAPPGEAETEVAQTKYLFGGSVGLHAFIARNWSIDPMLTAVGSTGSVSNARSDSSNKVESDISGVQVLLSIGLSGWIGAGAQRSAPNPSVPVREPYRPGFAPPADDDDAEDSAPPTAPLTAPLTVPPGAPPAFTPPESTDQAGSGPITK